MKRIHRMLLITVCAMLFNALSFVTYGAAEDAVWEAAGGVIEQGADGGYHLVSSAEEAVAKKTISVNIDETPYMHVDIQETLGAWSVWVEYAGETHVLLEQNTHPYGVWDIPLDKVMAFDGDDEMTVCVASYGVGSEIRFADISMAEHKLDSADAAAWKSHSGANITSENGILTIENPEGNSVLWATGFKGEYVNLSETPTIKIHYVEQTASFDLKIRDIRTNKEVSVSKAIRESEYIDVASVLRLAGIEIDDSYRGLLFHLATVGANSRLSISGIEIVGQEEEEPVPPPVDDTPAEEIIDLMDSTAGWTTAGARVESDGEKLYVTEVSTATYGYASKAYLVNTAKTPWFKINIDSNLKCAVKIADSSKEITLLRDGLYSGPYEFNLIDQGIDQGLVNLTVSVFAFDDATTVYDELRFSDVQSMTEAERAENETRLRKYEEFAASLLNLTGQIDAEKIAEYQAELESAREQLTSPFITKNGADSVIGALEQFTEEFRASLGIWPFDITDSACTDMGGNPVSGGLPQNVLVRLKIEKRAEDAGKACVVVRCHNENGVLMNIAADVIDMANKTAYDMECSFKFFDGVSIGKIDACIYQNAINGEAASWEYEIFEK